MTGQPDKNDVPSAAGEPKNNQPRVRRYFIIAAIIIVALVVLIPLLFINHKSVIHILGEQTSNFRAIDKVSSTLSMPFEIRCDMVPYDEFVKKANLALAGHASTYDILLQYPMCLSSYVKNGYILPVAEYDQYVPGKIDYKDILILPSWHETSFYRTNTRDDLQAYGYPFAANTMLLCYNKALFEDPVHKKAFHLRYPELVLDATNMDWEKFKSIAEYFSTVPDAEGICMEGQAGGWLFWEWCNFAYGMGGGVMDKQYGWESGKSIPLLLTSPNTIRATKFWLSLKPYNSPELDFFQTGLDQQIEHLRKGKTALALFWSDFAYTLLYGDTGNTRHLQHTLGFGVVPGGKPMLAGGFFMVSAFSSHKAEAIAFVREMLRPENQLKLAQVGLCSPIKEVYSMPEIKQLPYTEALFESLKSGRYMIEAGPECEEVSAIVTKYLQMIWREQMSVEEGLKAAQSEIEVARTAIYDDLKQHH